MKSKTTKPASRKPAASSVSASSPSIRYALFDTEIGRCGIAWGEAGVVGLQLPEGKDSLTRASLAKRFEATEECEPSSEIERAIAAIVGLLRGETSDLSTISLDMRGVPAFHQRVYALARTIEPGQTLTYGDVATKLGDKGSARAVGQALGRNPFAIVVPCHRVLASGGKMGGFTANGGVTTKLRMLAIEGAKAAAQRSLFDGDGSFGFDPTKAVAALGAGDPKLRALMESVGPFRMQLKTTSSIFVALAEAIVYQQLTAKAAGTIYARLCALFPRPHEGPTAEGILRSSDEKLRSAGLSRPKVLALRDLAKRAADGEIPGLADVHRMDDDDIVEKLTAVRGIGRWTVEMLLMFRLGRPDILPVDDYGIRKGYAAVFGLKDLPAPKELAKLGERWKPHRTVASWYLWRAAERAAAATKGT
ncbi:Methylated-DNA--protein-cysteine methyltransferase [Labilithrix luteola]|uniref:DNA-3-methyladenine glycosylase II n=1 Tax=Labilithrix luteola TaxID=1391654 RepID=A0A0K1PZ54_9BACT|nr:methylated-DNA--[protein]-cysteine S-methyltransferase [Labilithrix luteola]AKU98810.1 Methylated-DNA--protein-cysteine methyltransferase [Labilithrix luteola]